jgi:signal transduction histidine kinase
VISFTILRPIWQRWWFLSLAGLAVSALLHSIYRYRASRRFEVELVRRRIASDLHDDIGAGLSRISVLSEVARYESGAGSPVADRLSAIAGVSRELVDSMSDIVWVINPARDHLRDLTQRMRHVASDVFTSRGIEFAFHAPDDEQSLKIGAEVRRQLLLVYKESINNIVRHSICTQADIDFRIVANQLVLTMKDNGRGFDPAAAHEGNGLANMHSRASRVHGRLHLDSSPGRGSTVTVTMPLNARAKRDDARLHPV